MRVVGGELGGRKLRAPGGGRTRPTGDKVREALFSIIGDVTGARVLDLFAGSGALGIEALSRGASEAVFVEKGGPAVAAIKHNLVELGLEAEVHRREVRRFLRAAQEEPPFDLVFCDPPYDSATALAGTLAAFLPPILTDLSLIVTESDKRSPLVLPFPLERERIYGDTRLAVHRHV